MSATPKTLEQALERIAELEEANVQLKNLLTEKTNLLLRLPLNTQEREVTGLLLRFGLVSREKIEKVLWEDRADGGPKLPDRTINVLINKLRYKLRGIGVEIKTIQKFGYVMSDVDRAKLRNLEDADEAAKKMRASMYVRPPKKRNLKPAIPMSDRPKGKWAW